MKTRLAIVIYLAFPGVSSGAYGQFPIDIPAPAIGLPSSIPRLYPSEQGAFEALEVIAQIVESEIVQNGCQPAKYPLRVQTTYDGSGVAVLGERLNEIMLTVTLGNAKTSNGRWYTVTGEGFLNGLTVSEINSQGSYKIGSLNQESSTRWKASSFVTNQFNDFKGTAIKSYRRLKQHQLIPDGFDDAGMAVSIVLDYGFQQITMDNYIKAEYWQQSVTWRDVGVSNAGTYWLRTRVKPKGQACAISIKLNGYGFYPVDNIEGFNEKGYVAVETIDVGPYLDKGSSR